MFSHRAGWAGGMHCDDFSLRKLRSQLPLFMSEESQAAKPCEESLALAEAAHSLPPWGSQTQLLEEHEQVPLTSPPSFDVLMLEMEARLAVSSVECEDSLFTHDSELMTHVIQPD